MVVGAVVVVVVVVAGAVLWRVAFRHPQGALAEAENVTVRMRLTSILLGRRGTSQGAPAEAETALVRTLIVSIFHFAWQA